MAPTAILQHLKSYYTKDAEKDRPVILARTAALLSILYTLLYVLPFYLHPTTRPSPTLSRDAPSVIRARIRLVTLSSTLSTLLTIYLITTLTHSTLPSTLRLLGWYPIHPLSILRPLLLTILLFSGPLFEKAIIHRSWRIWLRGRALHESLSSWIGWRNYIATVNHLKSSASIGSSRLANPQDRFKRIPRRVQTIATTTIKYKVPPYANI
ncbi:hypothetical protein LPUS_05102 [Lasallia pustulata]|uniref:Uncharacterized protein n=1 Tax=Lasallia pustulata TaxID=136370 RepID=A0A1W5CYC7_9LECA|nr:hypothetical protein LPUS_05102 [Lasallia pustulata]